MKFLKKLLISFTILILSTSAFAISSGLNIGSAGTYRDDSHFYMNHLYWDKLEFNKFYGFTSIDSVNYLNFAAAQKINGDNVLAYAYNGNLWAEDSSNDISLFYGFNKMSIALDLGFYEDFSGDDPSIIFAPGVAFGYNITDKFGITASCNFGFLNYEEEIVGYTIKTSLTKTILSARAYYNFKDTEKLFTNIFFGYDGDFSKIKTTLDDQDPEISKESNSEIYLGSELEFKPTNAITYSMNCNLPIIRFEDTSTFFSFYINNGITIELKADKIFTSFGIETELPYIQFIEDGDTSRGYLENTFYFGIAVYLSPQIRLDGACVIYPESGISMSDIFQQQLNISISAKF